MIYRSLLVGWLGAIAMAQGAEMGLPLQLVATDCHDVEMREVAPGTWEVRTTGGDPYILCAPLPRKPLPDEYIVACEFFSLTGTDQFSVYAFPPLSQENCLDGPGLAHSEGWSQHAFDIQVLLRKVGGGIEGLRLDFGHAAGRTFQIRNVRLRPPTAAELALAARREAYREHQRQLDARLREYLRTDYPAEVTSVRVDDERIAVEGRLGAEREAMLAEVPLWAELGDDTAVASLSPVRPAADGTFAVTLDRHDGGRDRLLTRWGLVRREAGGLRLLSHQRYPDEVTPRSDLPEGVRRGRKGLGGFSLGRPQSDLDDLGIGSVTVNLLVNGVLSCEPGPDRTPYEFGGRTWYVNDGYVRGFDEALTALAEREIVVSLIVLIGHGYNAPDGSYARLIAHPDADPAGIFPMPNVSDRDGLLAYAAGLNYLAERYSGAHGRIHEWILHNEINAGWVWTNAGERTDVLYMDLYQKSLRTAYLLARQYDPHARVFISLEHHWTMHQDPRSHPGRDLLERLLEFSRAEGDFEWAIAFHPYPQSLFDPRVWADEQVSFSFDTPKITFRNLEVLDAWVQRPETWYRGAPRGVQLTEQGLNSPDYSEESLRNQAAGMAYAWHKLAPLRSIEAFDYHNWVDDRHEGGLRIGLRRFADDADDPLGRKPIWHVFQALDTPRQAEACAFALPVIGIGDWSEVRHRGAIR